MPLRDVMCWFHQVAREHKYAGPTEAAILLDDGSLVRVTYTNRDDYERAAATFDRYVGHVGLVPVSGKWGGQADHPLRRDYTLYLPDQYDTAEGAAEALRELVRDARATEEAMHADPATHLARELASFDWFAHYSDAPGVCGASDTHWKTVILPLKAKVTPEVWTALIGAHAPAECRGTGA